MITNVLLSLGINRDHWSLLWGKIISIALLINSGVFDLSAQAAYLGIHLTPTGAHWIQALAVIALYVSGQYSTSSLPGAKKLAMWLLPVLLVLSASACAGKTKFQQAGIGETALVQAVDAVVRSEQAAYKAGAYSQAQHQKYDAALLKVIQGEQAANDALLTWSATSGQPMPAAVVTAVKGLQTVLGDVQPLVPTNSAAAALAGNVSSALSLLLGVQ